MPAGNNVIRRDRSPPSRTTQPPAALARTAPLVAVIESSPHIRAAICQLLADWNLPVVEVDLENAKPGVTNIPGRRQSLPTSNSAPGLTGRRRITGSTSRC